MKIRQIPWEQTIPLRHSVLWPNKTPAYCQVDEDPQGTHFGIFDEELLLCVASIYVKSSKARLRKFATDTRYQKQGLGSQMLEHIIEWLKEEQVALFWCDARESALGFYQRFGMQICSERFYKADVPYFKVQRALHNGRAGYETFQS